MGLDSVELIVSFENYFGVVIEDHAAENIRTVQEAVEHIASLLPIHSNESTLKNHYFDKLKVSLMALGLVDEGFQLSDTMFTKLDPNNQQAWETLHLDLNLKLPIPDRAHKNALERALHFQFYKPAYHWLELTVDQFITALLAFNFETILKKESIQSQYEILVGVIGLTADKNGLDVYEVQPEKAFVHDLGID